MKESQSFLDHFKIWAENQDNIVGIVLVGSYARGTAREDSDVDLVILAKDPTIYLKNIDWILTFGDINEEKTEDEDWGILQTKRVFYKNGLEVEYGITSPEWAVDDGAKEVMQDGAKLLLDKSGSLQKIINSIH